MSSTEDYLDKLLRSVTGEPEPEPAVEETAPVVDEIQPVVFDEPLPVVEEIQQTSFEEPASFGVSNAEFIPTLDEIPTLSDIPSIDDIPTLSDIPSIDDIPTLSDISSIDEISSLSDISSIDDIPSLDDVSSLDNITLLDDLPSFDSVQVNDVLPVVEEVPVVGEAQVIEDVPVIEDIPAIEDAPVIEDIPAIEDIPMLENMPSLDDLPSLDDIPSIDNGISAETTLPSEDILPISGEMSNTDFDVIQPLDNVSDTEIVEKIEPDLISDFDNNVSDEIDSLIPTPENILSNTEVEPFTEISDEPLSFETQELLDNMPSLDDLPELEDVPAVEDIPALEDVPAIEDIPVLEDVPAIEDIPVLEDVPAIEDIPVLEDVPAIEDVPTLEDVPELEDVPVLDDIPKVEDIPEIEDVPVLEDIPEIEDIPVPEDSPVSDVSPSLDDLLMAEESTSAEDISSPDDLPMGAEPIFDESVSDIDPETADKLFDFSESLEDEDISSLLKEIDEMSGISVPDEEESPMTADKSLSELLSDSDDTELSEIGDLLDKDENHEMLSDSLSLMDDSAYDDMSMDSLLEMSANGDEDSDNKKKKKKKSLKDLFKKKKYTDLDAESEDLPVLDGPMEDMEQPILEPLDDYEAELASIEDRTEKKKKPGFFAKLIAALTKDADEESGDGLEKFAEEDANDIALAGAAENEQALRELEEEGEPKKKGKKKKSKKKGKGGDSDGDESEDSPKEDKKAKKKAEKEAKKAEREARKAEEAKRPTKKLPKKKVIPIYVLCFSLGVAITLLAYIIPSSLEKKKAVKYYQMGDYEKTYQLLKGNKLNENQKLMYDRTVVLLKTERKLDSYNNYMSLNMRPEALNALVQGVKAAKVQSENAENLGVREQFDKIYNEILDELKNTFGLSEEKVNQWIQIQDPDEYSMVINRFLIKGAEESDIGVVLEGEENATITIENDYDADSMNAVISAEETQF